MTIEEFIEEQKRLLNKFETFWLKNNSKDCETFPFNMEAGDWDEQLRLFDGETK